MGLIAIEARTPGEGGSRFVSVKPQGYDLYAELMRQAGEPARQVEAALHAYVDSHSFRTSNPAAYQKWSEAANLLWSADLQSQLTTIGHLCSEALQEFATTLVGRFQPPEVKRNREQTVARLKAVISHRGEIISKTLRPFLDALTVYWGTLNDLVERQEHGANKEGDALVWEDARRIVFHTLVVMYELDSALT